MRKKIKSVLIKLLNEIVLLKNKSRYLLKFTHKRYIKKVFYATHGYNINFENPTTFSEKIQWIKLYGPDCSEYVDKNEVRDFVEKKVGGTYLIPKIGVYESANDINIDLLPDKFVIKATHGCGWNLIVHDKSKLNWNKERKKVKSWINTNYFYISGEKNYKNIKGRVIIEQLLEDPTGNMKEYKFFCYHGQPLYVLVITPSGPDTMLREFYDINWNQIHMSVYNESPNTKIKTDKPQHFEEMLEICRKLSDKFSHVRVDLYYCQGKIYFGELTFTSSNGFARFSEFKYDKLAGEPLVLPGVKGI